ncbi:MAG: FtsQ-type POTRA domain-containing protein [Clostridia bacterium]|nr:FtsQ-type POTRA domain-containing protein [Clostridia bacterium]
MAKSTKKRTVIYSNVKENKKLAEQKQQAKNNPINLNDEVIIGFNSGKNNSIEDEPDNKKVPTKQGSKKMKPSKKKKKAKVNPQNKNQNKTQSKKRIPIVVKLIPVFIILAIGIIAFLKSPVFNIEEIIITIDNDNVLTIPEIEELSDVSVGENLFSISKSKIEKNIKRNSYVDDVKIKRVLPGKLKLEITERKIKFLLKTGDESFIMVDQHGVAVDNTTEKLDCICVTGYKTAEVKFGESLNDEDLEGLSTVISIMQEAENYDIKNEISRIDISDHNDYLVYFDNAGKVAHFGEAISLNDKMARVKKILEIEAEYQGEIYVNVNLNNGEYPYFRESV